MSDFSDDGDSIYKLDNYKDFTSVKYHGDVNLDNVYINNGSKRHINIENISDVLNIKLRDKTLFELKPYKKFKPKVFTVINATYIINRQHLHKNSNLLEIIKDDIKNFSHYNFFFGETDFNDYNKDIKTNKLHGSKTNIYKGNDIDIDDDILIDDEYEYTNNNKKKSMKNIKSTKKTKLKSKTKCNLFEGDNNDVDSIFNGMINVSRFNKFLVIYLTAKEPINFMKINMENKQDDYIPTYDKDVVRISNGLWLLDISNPMSKLDIVGISPLLDIDKNFNLKSLDNDIDTFYGLVNDKNDLLTEEFILSQLKDVVSKLN